MRVKWNTVLQIKVLVSFSFLLVSNNIFCQGKLNVLVCTKTNGIWDKSIPIGMEKISEWSYSENWKVTFSADSTVINDRVLEKTDVLVFFNITRNILGPNEREAFTRFINYGGGFVGVNLASNTENDWLWYHQMIGAQFKSQPEVQKAKISVKHTYEHPSTDHLEDTFEISDEWYNFKESALPHFNVVLTLDAGQTSRVKLDKEHPVVWYHYYEGGKVFYTGLAQTIGIYKNEEFRKHFVGAINRGRKRLDVPNKQNKWEYLLDQNLSKWNRYIGVPKEPVDTNTITYNDKGKFKKPLGFNNDPKNVFSTVLEKGKPVLRISGEIYGGLSTKQEYGNYHLKTKFKWGAKKWGTKSGRRDSGIIYHCVGPQGTYARAWMSGLQCQIQENHFGDFIAMGKVSAQARVDSIHIVNKEVRGIYSPTAKLIDVGRSLKTEDREKPVGDWNTLEIICLGTSSFHIINGKLVSAIENSKSILNGISQPLSSGRILLQSEGAEAYYKELKIKGINKVPKKYMKQISKLEMFQKFNGRSI